MNRVYILQKTPLPAKRYFKLFQEYGDEVAAAFLKRYPNQEQLISTDEALHTLTQFLMQGDLGAPGPEFGHCSGPLDKQGVLIHARFGRPTDERTPASSLDSEL